MPDNPNSQSPVTPPWLAKLNSVNEQTKNAISHVQSTPSQSNNPLKAPTQIETENSGFGQVHAASAIPSHEMEKLQTECESAAKSLIQVIAQNLMNDVQASKPTTISIEPNPTTNVVNPIRLNIDPAGQVEVPADLPPGHYAGACLVCHGTGQVSEWIRHGESGYQEYHIDCPVCNASGEGDLKTVHREPVGNLSQFQFNAASFEQAIERDSLVDSDVDGPGEEDGPWAEGWNLRSGESKVGKGGSGEYPYYTTVHINDIYKVCDLETSKNSPLNYGSAPLFNDKPLPDLEDWSKPAVEPLLSEEEIPSIGSWKPPVEVELPVVVEPVKVAEYVSPDTNQPTVSEEEYYAIIVQQLALSNPIESKLIERLRLFQSQYVGLITCPEQAIDHIALCRRDNVPIGGSDAVELSAQSTSLKHKQYIERRYAPHKAKREAVEAARKGWKDAIAQKEAAMKQWDAFVKWHHDNYAQLKKTPVECFQSKQGGESDAQSD